jgi:uncharacterized Zn-finger protein
MGVRLATGHGTSDGTRETERDISMDEPKIIHTETFSCADDHPIVWYTFDKDGKAMCEYCATHFVYKPKEKTYSEEMQDKIEPIDSYVNKILKGSG